MIWNETYSTSETCSLANVPNESLQNWLKRDLILGHQKIEGGGGKGKHRRFTWSNLMEIVIAQAAMKTGVGPREAFKIASDFSHAGVGKTGRQGNADSPVRVVGLPYHHTFGETLIYSTHEGSFIVCEGVPDLGEDRAADILRRTGAYIVVNASELFNSVCTALGEHPNEILDDAYPEKAGN